MQRARFLFIHRNIQMCAGRKVDSVGPVVAVFLVILGSGHASSFEVRLADGNSTSGRVEVRKGGTVEWGTVCDDRWDNRDATVVCRMLGFDSGKAHAKAAFGQGVGEIFMDEVGCSGDEENLIDCNNPGWENHNCQHKEDAGVTCKHVKEPQIRLVNGNSTSGRVEVKKGGTSSWGTVCDDMWDNRDATVVCRMLGFDRGKAHTNATFGEGVGPILLENIRCAGNELNLFDCKKGGWGNHDCMHKEDAGVTCQLQGPKLRLANGNSTSGRVEVRKGGTSSWGTVCDDMWDDTDATVVCRMLGFDSGKAHSRAAFGEGVGTILLDNVRCSGKEIDLFDCNNPGWGIHNCAHKEDAGVTCVQEPKLRLVNGNSTSGRVEVKKGGTSSWGTVCDDRWDNTDATVVCRMLGFDSGKAHTNATFGEGVGPILLDNVGCSGDEINLFDCKHGGWGNHDCTHKEDAGVTCKREDLQIRLANGNSTSGRVEIRKGRRGEWGTVCDDRWDDNDATVVCRMLGFNSGKSFVNASFGEGDGPILLDDVRCAGDESTLLDCANKGWANHNCRHLEDAGVVCGQDEGFQIRLANGNSTSGRVEVRKGRRGEWGTVCDDRWDDNDATVVCRMLGYDSGKSFVNASFGEGDGPILLDDVRCAGDESTLLDCANKGWANHNCRHWEDAGVVCGQVEDLQIRLANGNSTSGRVEVRKGRRGEWGTVCDDRWDDNDATVVCRMLGYDSGKSFVNASFGEGDGPILLDDVRCAGDESTLLDCASKGWANHNCRHWEDAGVVCEQGRPRLMIRIANGNSSSGRVEVRRGGEVEWGTVCDHMWDDKDATVVCRMLGFDHGRVHSLGSFGPGTGPVLMGDMNCYGNETTLLDCPSSFDEFNHDCLHEDDAAVACGRNGRRGLMAVLVNKERKIST